MERIIFWLFVLTLALAPLPYGSNLPAGWSALALAIGFLLLLWGLLACVNRDAITLSITTTGPLVLAFFLVCLWIWFQSLRIVPTGWQHDLWLEAAAALGLPSNGALGLNPDRGETGLMRLITYAGCLWLAMHLCRSRRRAKQLLWTLLFVQILYAAYGLVAHLSGDDSILGEPKWTYHESVTSTFVNRNSYATFVGMALLMSVVLLIENLLKAFPRAKSPNWRALVVRLFDCLRPSFWLLVGAAFVLATTAALTGSRGGFLAIVIALASVLLLITWQSGASRRTTLVTVLFLLGLLSVVGSFSGRLLDSRLGSISPTLADGQLAKSDRVQLYMMALRVISDFPITGTGLGSFQDVYFAERDESFGAAEAYYDKGHNTYLELVMEIGLPAAALIFAIIGWMFYRCLRACRQDLFASPAPLVAVGSTLLVAFHSLVDFSLQIPGLTVVYLAVLGCGVAQSLGRRRAKASPGRNIQNDNLEGD